MHHGIKMFGVERNFSRKFALGLVESSKMWQRVEVFLTMNREPPDLVVHDTRKPN
jgi:hypothetical protein